MRGMAGVGKFCVAVTALVASSLFPLGAGATHAALPSPITSVAQSQHQPAPIATPIASYSLAQGDGQLTYHNGPVQHHPVVYLIFWGAGWGSAGALSTDAQIVRQYFQDISPTWYNNVVTQYPDASGPVANATALGGVYVDAGAPPTDTSCSGQATVRDAAIQAEARAAIAAAGWQNADPANALFLVYTPSSVTVSDGAGACSEQHFCAYHKTLALNSATFAYGVVAYPTGQRACQAPASPHGDIFGESLASLSSQLAYGAATDPHPGTGWFDALNFEMGAKCGWQPTGAAPPPVSLNFGGSFELPGAYSNVNGACMRYYASHFEFSAPFINVASPTAGVSPPPQTITLTNSGFAPMNWALASTLPSWLSLNATSGTLASGGQQTLTLTFQVPASSTTQSLSTTLTFTDSNADNSGIQLPVTVVSANVAKTWYFAEGYIGGTFETLFTLANPGTLPATVTFTYRLDQGGGQVVHSGVVLPPNTRYTENVNHWVHTLKGNMIGYGVATTISSDQPIVAERPMYFTYVRNGQNTRTGFDAVGATSLAAHFAFADIDTRDTHRTLFTFLNPTSATMYANLTFYPAAGTAPLTDQYPIPANARGAIDVAQFDHRLAGNLFSATVLLTADAAGATPVNGLVERPMYAIIAATGYQFGNDVIGVPTAGTSWYFAEGFTGGTDSSGRGHFHESLKLAYPAAAGPTANVMVTIYKEGVSTPIFVPQTLAAGHTTELDINAQLPGWTIGNSIKVTSDQSILAERVMWWQQGATDAPGSSAPSNLLYFAEGYTGGGFQEMVTLQNPNAQPADVTVTFLPENAGTPKVALFVVAAQSRFTFLVNTYAPSPGLSLVVEANVPILAERPMYWSSGGTDVIGYQP